MKYAFRFLTVIPAVLMAGMVFAQNEATAPAKIPVQAIAKPAQAGVPAQASAETDPLMIDFQKKFSVYREISLKIEGLLTDFDAARQANDQAKMEKIRTEALPLMPQAQKAFLDVAPVAMRAYANSDGSNEELNQYMMMYANYFLGNDNYEEAYTLYVAFLKKGMHVKHPEIFETAALSAFGSNRFNAAKQCFNYAMKQNVKLSPQVQSYLDSIENYYEKEWMLELQKEQSEAKANNLPHVLIRTSAGDMEVELFENEAPNTVASFITLVEKGFYNGLSFHRVLPGFMAQGGCPKGDGTGDAGYKLPEEFSKPNARKHFRGSLAMARSQDPNSAGSQFYITFLPTKALDGQYTVFGRVVSGIETLSNIQRVDPEYPIPNQPKTKIIEMKVLRKQNHDYSKFKKM